jgi:uncharacterized membrane protein SirB2
MLMLNPLNASSSAFPVLESVHIAAIICSVGTAALVNLRLLGVGLTRDTPAQFWKAILPWTLGGLTLAIFSGLMLFSIDPEMYFTNRAFRIKMLLLLVAIVFYFTMVRKAARAASRGATATIVACVSLALWTLVPFGGIFIGFAGAPAYTYPILLSIHIVAIVLLGGMVLWTDLRLLRLAAPGDAVPDVIDQLRVPKRVAFALAAASGAVLFSAHAREYAANSWFLLKGALLALILVNCLLLRAKSRLAATLSLLLGAGLIWAARGPATVKDVMHSMVDPSGDFLFQSVQTISDERGIREIAPRTAAEWDEVRQRIDVLLDAPHLLEGRRAARLRDRSKNPDVENQPEEIQKVLDTDAATFLRRARRLQDAASVALKAADAHDKDALILALDGIDKACESCHLRYWYPRDKRAQEAAKADGIVE